ncbi:sororin isoform X2 [Erpetoichthys calabaricus]|uniref:sororin isoform X2 n=1 Tax=Erpetoichthys calabaricus TaxID=27687 RepID=UPI00109F4D49|nr:sororin isoform X2 [Erpetoichthys calabaricus]
MSNRKKRPACFSAKTENGKVRDNSLPLKVKSERNSLPEKMSMDVDTSAILPTPCLKRTITVRKIVPKKIQQQVTDNPSTPRRSPRIASLPEINKENLKPASENSLDNIKTSVLSESKQILSPSKADIFPINLITEPEPATEPASCQDPQNLVWSKKARRSYSRLSNQSLSETSALNRSDDSSIASSRKDRSSLYGFNNLLSPTKNSDVPITNLQNNSVVPHQNLLISGFSEVDVDLQIPGVVVVKEKKKKKKKVQKIKLSELDDLAAQMNAEFEAAEKFDLCIE